MNKYIDLHTHSKYSDGILTPTRLIEKAKEIGLAAVALTDHDSVDCLDEALEAGQELGIEVVPGIEISAYEGEREFHILGYFIDYLSLELKNRLDVIKKGRKIRAEKTVGRLEKLGFTIDIKEVNVLAAGTIGKPHLAMAVINNPANQTKLTRQFGQIPNTGQFIQAYFNKDSPAYVPKEHFFTLFEATSLIKKLGGVSSWAHPAWEMIEFENKSLALNDTDLKRLKEMGLDAVEVYAHYDDQELTKQIVTYFEERADALKLLKTGGSDYHGFGSAGKKLGFQDFYLKVDYELLEQIKKVRG